MLGLGVMGVQAQQNLPSSGHVAKIACRAIEFAQVIIGTGFARIQGECGLVGRDSLGVLTEVLVGSTEVKDGACVFG